MIIADDDNSTALLNKACEDRKTALLQLAEAQHEKVVAVAALEDLKSTAAMASLRAEEGARVCRSLEEENDALRRRVAELESSLAEERERKITSSRVMVMSSESMSTLQQKQEGDTVVDEDTATKSSLATLQSQVEKLTEATANVIKTVNPRTSLVQTLHSTLAATMGAWNGVGEVLAENAKLRRQCEQARHALEALHNATAKDVDTIWKARLLYTLNTYQLMTMKKNNNSDNKNNDNDGNISHELAETRRALSYTEHYLAAAMELLSSSSKARKERDDALSARALALRVQELEKKVGGDVHEEDNDGDDSEDDDVQDSGLLEFLNWLHGTARWGVGFAETELEMLRRRGEEGGSTAMPDDAYDAQKQYFVSIIEHLLSATARTGDTQALVQDIHSKADEVVVRVQQQQQQEAEQHRCDKSSKSPQKRVRDDDEGDNVNQPEPLSAAPALATEVVGVDPPEATEPAVVDDDDDDHTAAVVVARQGAEPQEVQEDANAQQHDEHVVIDAEEGNNDDDDDDVSDDSGTELLEVTQPEAEQQDDISGTEKHEPVDAAPAPAPAVVDDDDDEDDGEANDQNIDQNVVKNSDEAGGDNNNSTSSNGNQQSATPTVVPLWAQRAVSPTPPGRIADSTPKQTQADTPAPTPPAVATTPKVASPAPSPWWATTLSPTTPVWLPK